MKRKNQIKTKLERTKQKREMKCLSKLIIKGGSAKKMKSLSTSTEKPTRAHLPSQRTLQSFRRYLFLSVIFCCVIVLSTSYIFQFCLLSPLLRPQSLSVQQSLHTNEKENHISKLISCTCRMKSFNRNPLYSHVDPH